MDEKIEVHSGKIFVVNTVLEFIITIVALFILSILLSKTNLNENVIEPAIIAIAAFSILFGSFISGKKIKSKGIVFGALQGLVYMFILYLISSLATKDFSIGLESLIMIGIGILGGSIGGIMGVNIKWFNEIVILNFI